MKKSIMVWPEKNFVMTRNKVNSPTSMYNHHYHHNLEVYYLYSGERYYFIKDKTYHIKKGSLVFINEMTIHSTLNVNNIGYERFVFNFDRNFLAEFSHLSNINLFEYFDNNIHIVELDCNDQKFVEQLLIKMYEETLSPKPNHDMFIKTSVVQILLTALGYKKALSDKDKKISIKENSISEISAYINQNYHEDITLSTLSEKFYISVYHLSRTFKSETGLSFVDYLNNVRVKESLVLLEHSDLNITQISEKIGYKSATHFGRIFKKITGQSPLAYKKSKKADG